jgi:Asp-tRNA(Asn)/Glu-tRNA(Gln) amidotransferase A subunit family amidase
MALRQEEEEICYRSAVDLARMIRLKTMSPVEVVSAFIRRIEELNPLVNAFCTMTFESAMDQARQAERSVMKGDPLGPLHGVPFSVKDLIYTKGVRTMRGSRIYEHFVPEEDAPPVERLKAAGAILMGKTTTPEFGFKGTTDALLTGITRNPWNLQTTPGGSSGGAAAQDGCGDDASGRGLRTGEGRSVSPLLCTGVYGFKPTFGRVRLSGEFHGCPFHTGPITRTVGRGPHACP